MLGLALAGASAGHAATMSLVDNTNPTEVTEGGNDFAAELLAGQTLYIGIPYNGLGTWPAGEVADYFEVQAFLYGVGGDSTVSFSFYSAEDIGTESSSITQLDGMTAGIASVLAGDAGQPPSDPSNYGVANVEAQIGYANLAGNPFASITNGIVWLGITNTGSNTVNYYTGVPGLPPGFGTPSPAYTFGEPFDSTAGALYENSYIYDSGNLPVDGGENQNVHPYINITAETIPVPEPHAAALAGLAGVVLLLRRRI